MRVFGYSFSHLEKLKTTNKEKAIKINEIIEDEYLFDFVLLDLLELAIPKAKSYNAQVSLAHIDGLRVWRRGCVVRCGRRSL
jgi:hypothetical protein